MWNLKKCRMACVFAVAGLPLLLSAQFKDLSPPSYGWQEREGIRKACFLFSQAWFVMPNTSGGGLQVFGRGGRTWRLD